MKRRDRAFLLFAVILLVSAACGQRGASDNPGEENAVQTESDAAHPLYLTEEVRDLDPESGELCVVCNGWFPDYIKDCAASFSRKDADYSVLMEYTEESEEAYWDRTMAELVSGRGADLYYVSLSELQTLQEKGALADLRELLSEETLAAVWPGVLERGTPSPVVRVSTTVSFAALSVPSPV